MKILLCLCVHKIIINPLRECFYKLILRKGDKKMAQNVLFKIGTRAQFDAIVTKSETTLYWLTIRKSYIKVMFYLAREH